MPREFPRVTYSELDDLQMIKYRLRAYRQARGLTQADIDRMLDQKRFTGSLESAPVDAVTGTKKMYEYMGALGANPKFILYGDMSEVPYEVGLRLKPILEEGHSLDDADAHWLLVERGLK